MTKTKPFDAKITDLTSKWDGHPFKLSISLDYDKDRNDTYPVLLYVPHPEEPYHHHIHFNRRTAYRLRNWLNEYLGENVPSGKGS